MIRSVYWLWVPLAWAVVQALGEIFVDRNTLLIIHSEYGPHELIEFAIITAAFFVAAKILMHMDKSNKWLVAWFAVATVCCLYVSIEEISWGQTFLRWGTPEFWAEINVQEETNLHNTSDWLNQKPRILLEVGVAVGGLLIPALARWKPQWLPKRFEIIYPPAILGVTAGVFAVFRSLNWVGNHIFDVKPLARPSEISELYMFYFVLLYLVVMRQRLRTRT